MAFDLGYIFPSSLPLVQFVSVDNIKLSVHALVVAKIISEICDYIEADFKY